MTVMSFSRETCRNTTVCVLVGHWMMEIRGEARGQRTWSEAGKWPQIENSEESKIERKAVEEVKIRRLEVREKRSRDRGRRRKRSSKVVVGLSSLH